MNIYIYIYYIINKVIYLLYLFYTLLVSCGKLGPPYLGKTAVAARAALPGPTKDKVHAGSFRVSVCDGNPLSLNSDIDYRIFNVPTWSFMYTHGYWAHQQWVSTIFLTQKNSPVFVVLTMGFKLRNLRLWNPVSNTLPIEPARHPIEWSRLHNLWENSKSQH